MALVVALVLTAALIWSIAGRGKDPDSQASGPTSEQTCVSGDLALPIAAANETIGRTLIDAYAASKPVVRDYCVQPVYVDTLADAAVYIAPNTPITHQELANAGRTAAVAEPEDVAADVVGLATHGAGSEAAPPVDQVRFPIDTPASSAVAASLLTASDNDAVEALTDFRVPSAAAAEGDAQFIATSEAEAPGGWTFTPLDGAVRYAAIPLNSGDTIDENQSRAGQDFARAAAEQFDADTAPQQPVIAELVWAAALPTGGEALTGDVDSPTESDEAAVAADGEVLDTLFLLDTSEAMAPYVQAAKQGVAEAAGEVANAGHTVALWNYSSPLSEGVTQGYRRNVGPTPDAAPVQVSVQRFLTGGVPQTREAVAAAVDTVQFPARIVLITTGTADAGDDAAFTEMLRRAREAGVRLAVVHVGEGPQDKALEAAATSRQDAKTADEIAAAIKTAVGTRE